MWKVSYILFLTLAFILPLDEVTAKDDKALKKQRYEAQKERQATKNERSKEINEATRSFHEFSREIKSEYQDMLKDLDTEFELTRVELQADKEAKIATSEAEYQKNWSALFLQPEEKRTAEALKEMEKQGKAYANALFQIKKEAAEISHKAKMANVQKKHDLLKQGDKKAMDEAASLGLTKEYKPILATAIGGALTKQEERWNDREKKEVIKLKDRNRNTVKEFLHGEKFRAWERNNLDEDFQLKWKEKEELHKLNAEQTYYSTLLMQAGKEGAVNQQDIMAKFAEINKKNRLIKIKYNKIKQKNNITRRVERKKILGR